MGVLTGASVWLVATTTLNGSLGSGSAAWRAAVLLALGLAGIAIGGAHFLLKPTSRSQVIYRAMNGVVFAIVVGFVAFLGFDRWSSLYRDDPAGAVLWGLIVVATMFGFQETVTWCIRCVMFRSATTGDINDLLALTEDGRWKVAIHEAGHAVAYGLCATIPEDAYACIEPDLLTAEAGAVGFPRPTDATEMTKDRIEWMMICVEAGPAAEDLFFGDRCVLGAMDMNQLSGLAFVYLMSGFGEVVAMEPTSEQEIQANRAAVERLRERIRKLTADFLARNMDCMERIAKKLIEVEFLDCEGLEVVLRTAKSIPCRPLVSWPAAIPSISRTANHPN